MDLQLLIAQWSGAAPARLRSARHSPDRLGRVLPMWSYHKQH